MVTKLKAIYDSGIISDLYNGNISAKQDNTIERISYIRKYRDGSCSLHDMNDMVGVVATPQYRDTVGFFAGIFTTQPKSVTFFDMNKEKMKSMFLGPNATECTVFITYWYCDQKYTIFYRLPQEKVVFPFYEPDVFPEDIGEDCDCENTLMRAELVRIFDERNDTSAVGKKREDVVCDVTEAVREMIGPMNDFHGRRRTTNENPRWSMNVGILLDYCCMIERKLCPSLTFSRNAHGDTSSEMYLKLTYCEGLIEYM